MVNKKRSAKETFEEYGKSPFERCFIKLPGENPIDMTVKDKFDRDTSEFDIKRARKLYEERGLKQMRTYHIHGKQSWLDTAWNWINGYKSKSAMIVPSEDDYKFLFRHNDVKTMGIAQMDVNTGNLMGYLVVRKGRNYVPGTFIDDFNKNYDQRYELTFSTLPLIAKKYGLKYRFVPAEGYELESKGRGFVKKTRNILESKVAAVFSIGSLLLSLVFFSGNFTGNVIGINKTSSNWIGGILFIIGLVGAFFYFKNKK